MPLPLIRPVIYIFEKTLSAYLRRAVSLYLFVNHAFTLLMLTLSQLLQNTHYK